MFYGDNREQIRKVYFNAWQKHKKSLPLEPLELQLITVIKEHPEYHELFDNFSNIDADFTPEMGATNPFLHMGMHLAIRDQVATNRPKGIQTLYKKLVKKSGDYLDAEHQMMEILGQTMWQAMRSNSQPDEQSYLEACKRLV
jgi:Domain of unknown function (DUF1841)